MATAKQEENMLLTEHFTWPPISLIDDIINTINEVLYNCTNTLDVSLSSISPSLLGFEDRAQAEKRTPQVDEEGQEGWPEAKLEIEEGVLKLETLVENAVDKNFDKLEIWTLRNVFSLPKDDAQFASWVRLGHYENLSIPPTSPTITPESLQLLRRKLQETHKLHACLLAEKTRNEAQIEKLRSLLQPSGHTRELRASTSPSKSTTRNGNADVGGEAPFAFLTHSSAARTLGIQPLPLPSNGSNTTTAAGTGGESRTPLTTHTQFTTSQLPYLRQLLSNLKPHLATTSLPRSGEGEREELAKERRTYIESQSRRILERRGVDTRDGVEGGGSRIRAEDVRGLEALVGSMGRRVDEGGEGEEMDIS